MQLLIKTDCKLSNYNVLDNNVFLKKEISITYDCGSITRNFYISNNSWGNIILYCFYDTYSNFLLVNKANNFEKKIKGSEFFVHDSVYKDNKIYILTESGDIFYFNEDNPSELFFVKNVLIGVDPIDGERSYSFTYSDTRNDFIVSSNLRMVYPLSNSPYMVNIENPVFVDSSILASEICKTAIDIETGGPIQFVDIVEAAGHGFMFGESKNIRKSYRKIMAGGTIQEIDGTFNSGCQISDNTFVFYKIFYSSSSDYKIVTVDKSEESDGVDAMLGQF